MLLKISAGAGFSLRIYQSLKSILFEGLGDINYIAKKFDNTGIGVEDLISIGTIGLMNL